MPRFCVLASGSSGNAAFVETDGFGLLIDAGLGPRVLSSRLAAVGASWKNVKAVLLTHIHADHWKDRTLAQLRTLRIPLWCHSVHAAALVGCSKAFDSLKKASLIHEFQGGCPVEMPAGPTCLPIPISHDSDPTFAFRIEGRAGLFGKRWSIGYAADLGVAPPPLLDQFHDVSFLALEFNHDEELERHSGRPQHLIDRVMGDEGHLSNRQAAEAVQALLTRTASRSLRHIVQLHLSRHCNRPALAQAAARKVLEGLQQRVELHTACQDQTTKMFNLE